MSGFKLLAIRPSKDCDKQFLKNLKPGVFYKFYQDFDFELDTSQNSVIKINYVPSIPSDLFGKNINISAVVGKNGSGKSTIVELFCAFVFCLSKDLELIDLNEFKKNHNLSKEDKKRLDLEIKNFESFNCELYFLLDNVVFKLTKTGNLFGQTRFEKSESKEGDIFIFNKSQEIEISREFFNNQKRNEFLYFSYFYSILANYSLYGLNTNETGIWLRSIFHKNDGYQTPIVLNPMRTKGVMDVNRITYLSKSRLLSNVFLGLKENQKEEESLRCLVNDKIVDKIILNLDLNKFTVIDESNIAQDQNASYILDIADESIYLTYTELNKKRNNHDYLKLLIESFYPKFSFNNVSLSNSKIKKISVEYILRKAEYVIKKYPQFKAYRNKVFRVNAKEETIRKAFQNLAIDFTHSTFKLRQALNFLIYGFYDFNDEKKKVFSLSNSSKEGIADIVNKQINKCLNIELEENKISWRNEPDSVDRTRNDKYSHQKYRLINFLPPSFFEIDFEFRRKGFYKDLSSGEKQMVFSINSIIYHLINLDSITSMEYDIEDEMVSYKNFNIIFDEIELYFHPEFQRIYINELIKSLSYLETSNYKFNIIFFTHSPFILSDIPKSNIMKLLDGKPKYEDDQTYASNVHDLLANDFYLDKGFMGEFVRKKIRDLLIYLTEDNEGQSEDIESPFFDWSQEKALELISIIGEPLLKYDLKELYYSKFYSEVQIDNEIEKLQELKRQKRKNDIN